MVDALGGPINIFFFIVTEWRAEPKTTEGSKWRVLWTVIR